MIRLRYFLICLIVLLSFVAWGQPGQIVVSRVELMPNQPSPYNLRDWKVVAMQYDSFVYDITKTGQYLPLTTMAPAGVNYPQNPWFRVHTYVGTNSPLNSEGINVLPSLVGASLVGIDKSNQFGKNWILMSQDFFNKNNGELLYLNAPSTTSGGDWWYDMMPNVFFYQLYDLYPGIGGEAELQFTSIANRFAEAVKAMGGHDAPWNHAFMNYRAWKFKTMEPNASGVPEPEAAGAFAWALYNAWKETGDPEYLRAAEWSIEFLDNWESNPSYELQLPYGTLAAARMNAELGTDYDIEKMVNWSFNKGPLRGWGTIVGNWGGFEVSGLVGEANDGGNDYAFQLNGVQQAAALVPMVRYDKRFARAIGKWTLNLANATRLFYHGFLPANQQDASAWSAANDPGQVIGYEAMREVWQGNSPYSTGDALQGGWAATNLALYGTSSIGYLGAIVEKTDVSRILQLDLLATDFYRDEAYPTYLIYNSYNTAKTVTFDAGPEPADLYETLSETFIQENVTGPVSLLIPANQAIVVTVAPAGGEITYDRNKMLINGVVVDYSQSAQSFTWAPRLKGLGAAKNPLELSDSTVIYATVSDRDSEEFTYEWSAPSGTFNGEGSQPVYKPGAVPGEVEIQCIVTDPDGNKDTATLLLSVVPEINEAPIIASILRDPAYAGPGGSMQLTCVASDPDLDDLSFDWEVSAGTITGSGSAVSWNAPLAEGIYQVTVTVADDEGLEALATTALLVKDFGAPSGDLIAWYPFSGNADDHSGNELDGQVNGAILTGDHKGTPQSAYYFNGGSQHIFVDNDPLLNFQEGITVSCWFRADALPENETFLLSHGSWQNRWKLSITPDKRLRWTVKTTTSIADADAVSQVQQDSFYHVTVTYDQELLAIYINGELDSYKALEGLIRTTVFPFLIGQMLPGETAYNFKGVIDEIKIYDYAMTPDSVKASYEQYLTSAKDQILAASGGLKLSPNPVRHTLNIEMAGTAAFMKNLRIYDQSGRLVFEKNNLNSRSADIDASHYPPGIYQITCTSENGLFTARFVRN
jgi:hypothetical protein